MAWPSQREKPKEPAHESVDSPEKESLQCECHGSSSLAKADLGETRLDILDLAFELREDGFVVGFAVASLPRQEGAAD